MITKYFNANIIGFDNNIYKNGCLVFNNEQLVFVGEKYSGVVDNSINLNGKVIMPTLCNMFVNVNENFENALLNLTNNGVFKCVFNGHLSTNNLEKAHNTLESFGVTINVNKLDKICLEQLEKSFLNIKKYALPIIYIEQILDLTENEIEQIYLFSKKHDAVVMVLANNNLEDVGICHNETKQTPIELIESYGLFDLNLILLKCQSVDKFDLEILKKYNAKIVVMPIEDLISGDGITPITSFVNANLKLSLGNKNVEENFFNQLRIIQLTQSGYLNIKNAVDSKMLINMVCQNYVFKNNGFIVLDFDNVNFDKLVLTENKKILHAVVYNKQIF